MVSQNNNAITKYIHIFSNRVIDNGWMSQMVSPRDVTHLCVRGSRPRQDFERILNTHHASLMGDPFIKLYIDDILRTMRTQVGVGPRQQE